MHVINLVHSDSACLLYLPHYQPGKVYNTCITTFIVVLKKKCVSLWEKWWWDSEVHEGFWCAFWSIVQWLKAPHCAARHLLLIDLSFMSLAGVTDGKRWKESSGSLNKGTVSNSRHERFGRQRLYCLVILGTLLQADERLANIIAQLKMCHSFFHSVRPLIRDYLRPLFPLMVPWKYWDRGSQQSVWITWRCQDSATRRPLRGFPVPFGALMMENMLSPLFQREHG